MVMGGGVAAGSSTRAESELASQRTAARVRSWITHRPSTIALVLGIVVLSVLAHSLPELGIESRPSDGALAIDPDHWVGTTVSLFAVPTMWTLAVLVPLAIVVLELSERTMGSARTFMSFVVGGALSAALGIGVGLFEEQFVDLLPLNAPALTTLTPVVGLIATATTASCFASALWRRRFRLVVAGCALTLFLYSGTSNDLFSLTAVPIGLGLGFVLAGRRDTLRLVRSSHHEKRVVLAALTFITAAGPVLASAAGPGAGLLSMYGTLSRDPLLVVDGTVCALGSAAAPCDVRSSGLSQLHPAAGLVGLLPALIAMAAAWGISRGRRDALWLAVAVNGAILAVMTLRFLVVSPTSFQRIGTPSTDEMREYLWQSTVGTFVAVLVPLITVVMLIVFRREARAASAARSRLSFVRRTTGGLVVALIVAAGPAALDPSGFRPSTTALGLVAQIPLRLLPPSLLPAEALSFVPVSRWAQISWYVPSLFFWMVFGVASLRLMLAPSARAGVVDRARVHALLRRGGGDNLSYMATWEGNRYWFASELDAAFAFRVTGDVAVTLGGAFGPDAQDSRVSSDFIEYCGDNGWTPIFYSVVGADTSAFSHLGWRQLPVAEDAVLDLAEWNTAGKHRQDIRTATNRAAREGVVTKWTRWQEMTVAEHAQVRQISEEWVAARVFPEMEFTLGGVDQLADPAVRVMLAQDAVGRVQAVTSWLPLYRADGSVTGYTLDFMRRGPTAMNGVMEFAIGAVATLSKEAGLTHLSLSGSPLTSDTTRELADDAGARVLNWLGAAIEPGYGFRTLMNFKRKFQPRFETMWMIYPDSGILPSAAVAIARAYLPDVTFSAAARMAASLRRPGVFSR